MVGGVLVGITAAAGLWFHLRPEEGRIDTRLAALVGTSKSRWFLHIAALHQPWIVVGGAVLAAALTLPRDRPRALACLIGPPLALAACEVVVKPAVGRSFEGVLSYPSGSTVGAAALAAAVALATPARWRLLTSLLGAGYVLAMCTAVVALRWHYPSDALAGAAFGAGVVLVMDGASWWIFGRRWRVLGRRPAQDGGVGVSPPG